MVEADGSPRDVVANYLRKSENTSGRQDWPSGISNASTRDFRIQSVRCLDSRGNVAPTVMAGEAFAVEIEYVIDQRLPRCRVGFSLQSIEGTVVFQAYDADLREYDEPRGPGQYVSRCAVPANLLGPGSYSVSVNAGVFGDRNLARVDNTIMISVDGSQAIGSHFIENRPGILRPRLQWNIRQK